MTSFRHRNNYSLQKNIPTTNRILINENKIGFSPIVDINQVYQALSELQKKALSLVVFKRGFFSATDRMPFPLEVST